MTWRSSAAPLVAGRWVSSAYPGNGIRGDAIPTSGEAGPPPLANDISLPADAANEFRILVLSRPAAGVLTVGEDSAFIFSGAPDGAYTWTYQAYRNGVAFGGVSTVNMTVGAVAAALAGGAQAASLAQADLATAIRAAAAAFDVANATGGLTTAIRLAAPAVDQVQAGGLLTVPIPLQGAALDNVGAVATLTVQIAGLGGDAVSRALAQGDVTTGIRLAGASLSVTSASGQIAAVPVSLAGAAVSLASAGGALTTAIRFAGTAQDLIQAAGDLSGGSPAAPQLYTFYATLRRAASMVAGVRRRAV